MGVKLPTEVVGGFGGGKRRARTTGRTPSAQTLNTGTPQAVYEVPATQTVARGLRRAAGAEAAFARGAGGGLQAFAQLAEQMGQRHDRLALSMARAQFIVANEKAQAELTDGDYATYKERYLESIEASREAITGDLPGRLHQQFEVETMPGIARGQIAVGQRAQSAYQTSVLNGLDAMEAALPSAGGSVAAQTEYVQAYSEAINAATAQGFLTPEEARLRRHRVASGIAKNEIAAWYRAQPDPYGAAVQIHEGAIPDPRMQSLLDMLSPEDRTEVFNSVVAEESKLATLKNRVEQDAEDGAKDVVRNEIKRFYYDDEITPEEQYDILERMKVSEHASENEVGQMELYLRQGGRQQTVEADRTFATREISAGTIRSADQLIEVMGEMGWEISPKDMRTLEGSITAMQNKRFSTAMKWGAATLGVPQTGGFLGNFMRPSVDKLSKFQADMYEFQVQSPDGKFMDHAKQLLETETAQTNSEADVALPVLYSNYRQALATGDPGRIEQARKVLDTMLIAAGKVTFEQTMAPGYDPLTIFEQGPSGGGSTNP